MSKDDMETNTVNVMFDGSDEKDDNDEFNLEESIDKAMKELEDDYNMYYRLKRYCGSR